MKSCFITFRSMTAAQKGEASLRRAGILCSISRTPRWMEEQGCGSGLRVGCSEISEAVEVLRANRVPIGKVYLRREEGKMEEMEI